MTFDEYKEQCKRDIEKMLETAYNVGYDDGYNNSPQTLTRREREREEHNGLCYEDSIIRLGLPNGIKNKLCIVQIKTIGQLCNKTTDDMLKLRNIGKTKLEELLAVLHKYNFKLKDEE